MARGRSSGRFRLGSSRRLAAAGGLAFINSIGTIGGFVGPTIMGWLRDTTGSYSAGLLAMSGFLLAAAGLAASLKLVKHGE